MTWMAFLAENAWKGTMILAAACAGGVVLRKASASLRHLVWTAAFAALLMLPGVIRMAPRWSPRVAVSEAYVVESARVAPASGTRNSAPLNWPLILWLTGCSACVLRFLIGAARTSWMVRRAAAAPYSQVMLEDLGRSLHIGRRLCVLESGAAPMPLTWGVFRPVVVLPDGAAGWPEARLRAVLLHELVHVRRLDLVAQAVAQAACALYWFHPLAWVALRQFRKERECACDDAVLLRGVPAHDYAGHLLDLVRALAAKRRPWAGAPALAEPSDLELRVRALLDRGRNRSPVSRRAAVAIAVAVVAVLLPIAGITAHAQAASATLAGTVTDPSGARIPHCRVTAKNLDGSNQETAMSDPAGEYRFASIPPGSYSLEFGAPGFVLAKSQAVLVAGGVARVDAHLAIGSVTESVVIRGQKPVAGVAPRAETAQRIRVGGSVTPARLIRQTKPVYPAELQQLGVEGTVVIAAIISKDGTVLSPKVRNTVDARLSAAALDAVSQWAYQPALLNGQPVETITTITLDFQLGQ